MPPEPPPESRESPQAAVAAIEETAHEAAEAVEAVAETVTETVDQATGEVPSHAAEALTDRVAAMETALHELRTQLASLPGMAELGEAAEELGAAEGEAAGAAEAVAQAPVRVIRVEPSGGESPPHKKHWINKLPRWL